MVGIYTEMMSEVTIEVRLSRSCHKTTKAQKGVSSIEKMGTNIRLD